MTDTDIEFADEETAQIVDGVTVDVAGMEQDLEQIVDDVQKGHRALDNYKQGALNMRQALDERRMQAKRNDNDELVDLLDEFKEDAYLLYLRLNRGDLELVGERDGKFSGMLESRRDE